MRIAPFYEDTWLSGKLHFTAACAKTAGRIIRTASLSSGGDIAAVNRNRAVFPCSDLSCPADPNSAIHKSAVIPGRNDRTAVNDNICCRIRTGTSNPCFSADFQSPVRAAVSCQAGNSKVC